MNLFTGEAADELFGGEPPATVRPLLAQAQQAPREEIPPLLWAAQASAPQALSVYYLLYKCHAGRREFALAEKAARLGLAEAARQAGLPGDWRAVAPGASDFAGTGPQRFWLFTLKALAFIAVRSGRPDEARALLDQIARLDPQASVGGEVIASLLASVTGPRAG
ncbi:hypothetical protein [Ideonella oryzae]|uniref:Tetratricopeptide repeat protein n=1 Tax=Ideonella oryzae TaxID=2937441 RepID=A0ABT1BMQ3_9BURK|nr:hypothetical protein [Ideonella oryzae]MCO5977398.1 hypothetical protein [Ideonella oryzae]